jgi:hypothetical protein
MHTLKRKRKGVDDDEDEDEDDDNDDNDVNSAPLTMYSLSKKLKNFRGLKYFWLFRIPIAKIGKLVKW